MVVVRLGCLGVVHQSPACAGVSIAAKDEKCWCFFVRPPRCSILVPQSLSVMNSVKA